MRTDYLPKHVGIILDGNRRWAKENGLPTFEGHRKGYDNLKTISEAAFGLGVEYVSAFIFSSENWNRSKEEVGYLMNMALSVASKEINKLIAKNYKIVFLGSRDKLSKKLIKAIDDCQDRSAGNTGGTMAICFNYGGKAEIVDAMRKIISDGGVAEKDLSTDLVDKNLYHPEIPPLDFLIRTSGEMRISNFMLWRAAYAELYFVDKHWPEFSVEDLEKALEEFASRQRRFGK